MSQAGGRQVVSKAGGKRGETAALTGLRGWGLMRGGADHQFTKRPPCKKNSGLIHIHIVGFTQRPPCLERTLILQKKTLNSHGFIFIYLGGRRV